MLGVLRGFCFTHACQPIARTQNDGGKVLRAEALAYNVDSDAIALKVKHEFAAKEKGRAAIGKGAAIMALRNSRLLRKS